MLTAVDAAVLDGPAGTADEADADGGVPAGAVRAGEDMKLYGPLLLEPLCAPEEPFALVAAVA